MKIPKRRSLVASDNIKSILDMYSIKKIITFWFPKKEKYMQKSVCVTNTNISSTLQSITICSIYDFIDLYTTQQNYQI